MKKRPRLGLIAFEYPPLVGGMGTYARALAEQMRSRYELHIFTNLQAEPQAGCTIHPILTTDLARDLPRLARYRMDLWHSINFGYAPLAMIKRPFVLTVHGTDFLTPWIRMSMDRLPLLWRASEWMNQRSVRRIWYAPALRCVDQVLVCSRFSGDLFRREYPGVGRLEVVSNGVATDFLEQTAILNQTTIPEPTSASSMVGSSFAGRRCRLLSVGNLDTANRRKNIDGVIEAMARIGDRLDLEYVIVGDGSMRGELEALARQCGVASRVHFRGRVSQTQLRAEYAAADLFVMVPRPQPGDVEGFGIVYLEAAACGTPSLAGRCGGAPEAIKDGQTGFFVREPTPAGIATALEAFFTGQFRFDPQVIRDHAVRHAWPRVLERVEQVYQRLLASPAHCGAGFQPAFGRHKCLPYGPAFGYGPVFCRAGAQRSQAVPRASRLHLSCATDGKGMSCMNA